MARPLSSFRETCGAAAALALVAFAIYANALHAPFVFDDVPAIVENPSIRHLWPLGESLSPPAGGSPFSSRPLVNLSFAVNQAIGGDGVWSYHVLNLAIHVGAGLTLFGFVRRTLQRPLFAARFGADATLPAFLIALLWIAHPLQTEAVTYLAQRAESLMALCFLLTLYGFARATGQGDATKAATARWRARGWFVVSWIACLLGMAAKEVMVAAPVVVFLFDRTFVAGDFRTAWRERGKFHAALAATWLLLGWLVLGNPTRGGTAGFTTGLSVWDHALTQAEALARYARLVVWPHPLVFDYGSYIAPLSAKVLLGAALVIALGTSAVAGLRRGSAIGFGSASLLAILAPSSCIPIASQTIAEHRMYLPLAGVIAFGVAGIWSILGRRAAWLLVPLAVVMGGLTMKRNEAYRSEIALWGDTVANWPANARARNNLGDALRAAGRFDEAVTCYEIAVRTDPNCFQAQNNLGNFLMASGRPAEAREHYERALAANPAYAEAHVNLGAWLAGRGQLDAAIAHLEQALRAEPDFFEAHYNLGLALLQAGQPAGAAIQFERALQICPDSGEARAGLTRARR